ncbi:MAG: GntR family transcriptional regulator [Roseobacter sp.]
MDLKYGNAVVPQLHDRLRDQIVSCALRPGQRISETEIATTYEVSGQLVREACIKLAEKKLVVMRPQRGIHIRRISVSAALTARFIREAVEVDLVRRVVERLTPVMMIVLDGQILKQQAAAHADDAATFMQLDEAFHRSLAEFADAPAVSDYLDDLNIQMNRVRNISARHFSPNRLVVQHASIVEGIRNRDKETTERALRTHLGAFKQDLPKIIEAYPDYFDI